MPHQVVKLKTNKVWRRQGGEKVAVRCTNGQSWDTVTVDLHAWHLCADCC